MKALLPLLLLTCCCVSFLTGHGLIPLHGLGVGNPIIESIQNKILVYDRISSKHTHYHAKRTEKEIFFFFFGKSLLGSIQEINWTYEKKKAKQTFESVPDKYGTYLLLTQDCLKIRMNLKMEALYFLSITYLY